MQQQQKSSMSSSPSVGSEAHTTKRGSDDPGWKYAELIDPKDLNTVRCRLCGHISKGGIYRLKKHLVGIRGDVKPCSKATDLIKEEIRGAMETKKTKRAQISMEIQQMRDAVSIDDEEELLGSIGSKKPRVVGSMDRFTSIDPEVSLSERKKMKQTSIKDPYMKEKRDRVCSYVAEWFYEAGLPFHTSSLKSFTVMLEAVGQYGPGFKAPTQYELGGPLLKKSVEKTTSYLKAHKDAWKKTGCSIMTDAWSDRKNRSIMNLCVHCQLGTSFLRSVDSSNDSHTGEYIHDLIESCIKEVGEENVLQVVTNNASNNMAAAKLLNVHRPSVFWTSCAAHTLDLVLEGIGNKHFKEVIDKARGLTVFIYSHHKTLSMMRRATNGEIVRPGITRFATSFLTLQSLHEKKDRLRGMFTSDEWAKCKLYRTASGKKCTATVVSQLFWSHIGRAQKIFSPLVRVLRIVDADHRPSMGFVYGALQEAIKEIKAACKDSEHVYKPYLDIVNEKCRGRLDSPLHLAGYFLNPFYFYKDGDEMKNNEEIMDGVFTCIETFYPDMDIQLKITNVEMQAYKDGSGQFGRAIAVKARTCTTLEEFKPAQWWDNFGNSAPYLQKMAIKILSLTTSSSGCERNWSAFEGIHTKKRNRLGVQKLNDLVYVQFNARLKNREEKKDPLASKLKENATEWFVGEGSGGGQQEDDDMPSWDVIADAMGADDFLEPRRSTRGKGVASSSGGAAAEDEDVHADDDDLIMSDEATDEEDLEEDLGDFDSDNESEAEEAN